MKLHKEMKIQRLQDKNRMVGETFNPTGITSEQILSRETEFVNTMKAESLEFRKAYWQQAKEVIAVHHGSWFWEWSAFKRHFIIDNVVY